ncbi:phenylacetate--CoA ligase [Methanoculleus sp. YWC-01]|jgi:phenylacetate-CoA ligase|uniref:Phenylacetate--CoA ligase n=1 Tax=Methanoculleus nereidis TaxID=2735141 RepID=A0ABU3Z3L4_9EURY|nr:phenylacetate--CoA ligase [Methanoculleus sp. YWC-01]MCK9298122.1 phenylacetate--CoA ligase [Methanoculleus sp.]MDV4343391.1 phenylacetate--CoA ligase [Methanoculleus sp. YWC-01]PKL57071.1 MAG: phenylacetate--CoA ligase [Methanomicrobiales archaeon HGW-Methanomicrobiales-6]
MAPWNPRTEGMPLDELRRLQFKLVKSLVYRLYSFNDFYRRRMKEQQVHPDDIRTLEDVAKLPFMYKSDLRDGYPDRIFSAEQNELVRYHVSSGTTGKPTVVGYTERDIENWSESLARAFSSCGLGRGDVMQVSYGYGLFTGGLGAHYGAERVGATVLPTSVGNTERQIELMQDLRVTAIACTPSYLLHMGEVAEKMGVSIKNDTDLRMGFLGAEPWSEQMRGRIEDWLGIRAYDIYGTSELSGPMFTECTEQQGIHIWGDLALVEIVDPATGEVLPTGEQGELTVTMLQKEALPMVRYRIGDLTAIEEGVCPCGRTHPRIGRIRGRVDDMLIVRGINVFPSQVEHALLEIPEVGRHFQIVVDRKGALDSMLVRVEVSEEAFSDKITDLMVIKRAVEHRLRGSLNVSVDVELVEPGTLPRFEGKSKKVVDRRSL